ncbi:PREDICTED: mitochondrial inner membrane protein OXA1L [Nicrophorus vespilloides]|uniref:Mitochondrial inner membrane protein OXA1L n=1 Tax=Nicrophorus vespilloides TaxID=110193 RepID=A0ABM1ME23_NICVS|nr:PREDICTED: mitochondrial inner membrane protein OXA1L [Nicrophorus vespilloides]
MFRRGNLASKYREYAKSLKFLKSNLSESDVSRKAVAKCEEVLQTLKTHKISHTQVIDKYRKTLAVVQSKFGASTSNNEDSRWKELQSRLSLSNTSRRNIFTTGAIGVFSSNATPVSVTDTAVEVLPEAPVVPDVAAQIVTQLNALGEPTFASQGLGGWTPVGIVQNCFEYLHGSLGIPWWEAIAIGTLVIRFCLFPLVIMAQRNAAKMNNNMPQMQVIQLKMTEARQSGNQLEVARYSQELMTFMREKNMNPFKNMIVPLAQMPVFVSFFMGLREMANVPLDSMRTGGLFWFTDLTVPDQFFILPIITSATLWATVELGTDSAKLSAQNMQTMKYVLRALPIVILPFTVNFPGAILCYWMASNFISLAQVGFLRIPAVRTYFDIDALLTHNPKNLPIKNKGFVGGIKESWTNIKITKELEERRRLDEMQFQRAGKGPLVKTYKYDPTKQAPKVAAKNR